MFIVSVHTHCSHAVKRHENESFFKGWNMRGFVSFVQFRSVQHRATIRLD